MQDLLSKRGTGQGRNRPFELLPIRNATRIQSKSWLNCVSVLCPNPANFPPPPPKKVGKKRKKKGKVCAHFQKMFIRTSSYLPPSLIFPFCCSGSTEGRNKSIFYRLSNCSNLHSPPFCHRAVVHNHLFLCLQNVNPIASFLLVLWGTKPGERMAE